MRTIRQGVFETNSSSCHSLSITDKGGMSEFKIQPNCNNQVTCVFSDFDGYQYIDTQEDKLSYLCTYVALTELRAKILSKNDDPVDEFLNTKGFQLINDFVGSHCNGINVSGIEGLFLEKNENCSSYYVECEDGAIDHNALTHSTLKEWLDDNEITVEKFVLDNNITLIIARD